MTKRILVMSFGSDAGGIEKSLIEFLRYLSEKDVEIDLYLWRQPGILFQYIPKTVNILSCRLYPGSLKKGLDERSTNSIIYIIWYLFFRLCRLIGCQYLAFRSLKKEYDIAISYCQNGYSPYYIIDKVKASKKLLWYHHGSYEKRDKDRKLDAEYYSQYDRIITVSKSNKTMLEQFFPLLRDKIVVIQNLINEEEIIELSTEYKI